MSEAKKREVEQLLRDYRAWYSPFGGALAPEDSHVRSADYGPAGLIFSGCEFEREDRRLLRESFEALRLALVLLRSERGVISKHSNGDEITGLSAWTALIEPYLADPADPSIVDGWRKSEYISAKRFLERHDVAIEKLAQYLRKEDLHVVFPVRMSENEEQKMERQNADIYAKYQALRVSGLTRKVAIIQTAKHFRHGGADAVERIVEFRSENKSDQCAWGGCDRAPFSQNLCIAHYHQQRRKRKAS